MEDNVIECTSIIQGFANCHEEDKIMYKELLETLQDKFEISLKDMVIKGLHFVLCVFTHTKKGLYLLV